MSFKKKIVLALMGVTMLGALTAMPAVKVGNVVLGTQTVEAYSGTYTKVRYSHRQYRPRQSRKVYINTVYNRNGKKLYSYNTYGPWHRYSVG